MADRALADRHALGLAGRARGVDHVGRVLRAGAAAAQQRIFCLLQQLGLVPDRAVDRVEPCCSPCPVTMPIARCVLQADHDALGRRVGVEGQPGRSGLGDGELAGQQVDAARQPQADDLAGPYALAQQVVRHQAGALVELAVAQAQRAADQGGPVLACRRGLEQVGEHFVAQQVETLIALSIMFAVNSDLRLSLVPDQSCFSRPWLSAAVSGFWRTDRCQAAVSPVLSHLLIETHTSLIHMMPDHGRDPDRTRLKAVWASENRDPDQGRVECCCSVRTARSVAALRHQHACHQQHQQRDHAAAEEVTQRHRERRGRVHRCCAGQRPERAVDRDAVQQRLGASIWTMSPELKPSRVAERPVPEHQADHGRSCRPTAPRRRPGRPAPARARNGSRARMKRQPVASAPRQPATMTMTSGRLPAGTAVPRPAGTPRRAAAVRGIGRPSSTARASSTRPRSWAVIEELAEEVGPESGMDRAAVRDILALPAVAGRLDQKGG